MKIKSKTLGLIFGSIAIGTTAIVPAVVLSSCAEDVSTTITINQTLSNQIVEKINGIATLDGQLDTDVAKKKLEDSKGTVATIIGVTNASDISTIEVTTTSIVITIQNKAFTPDSTGFTVAKNDTWKTPEIKITTEANKITLSSTTALFKQGTGGTDNNQQPSTPVTITQDQATALATAIKTACGNKALDGNTVPQNLAEEKLNAAKNDLATAVGLTGADITSITVTGLKTITINISNKTLVANETGFDITDPAGKVTTTTNTIVVTGTGNLFSDKIGMTKTIADAIAKVVNEVAPFATTKQSALTGLQTTIREPANKTKIAQAINSSYDNSKISQVTLQATEISISTTGISLVDNGSEPVLSSQIGGLTLKFVVSGGNTITITNSASGEIYKA